MNYSKSIGGYFQLELNNFGTVYHDNAIALNSGRNALEYILIQKKYSKVYIPYFTCDVILQPLQKLDIEYEFYHLDNSLMPQVQSVGENEVLLYTNYFGILSINVKNVIRKFVNVMIDNSQAFYDMPVDNIPTFYSPRKFFGLPDGGFAYVNRNLDLDLNLEVDKSMDRVSHLIARIENGAEAGYKLYQKNDEKLNNLPLLKMSQLTNQLLNNINFEAIRKKRNENFDIIHQALKYDNELSPMIETAKINGPMVYPFLRKGNNKLRYHLISNKILVARYWPNVIKWLEAKNIFERYLYCNLIPLPIDQRSDKKALKAIVQMIK